MQTKSYPFEVKSTADSGVIEGVISAFGGVDSYGDTIAHGAYSASLAKLAASGRALPLLYQHDPQRPIGTWTELRETETGLHGRGQLVMEVRDAQEAFALAKRGALTGISIGFNIAPGGSRNEGDLRILSKIDLVEASLVTFPADPKARVTGLKAIASAGDIADLLREAGLSGRKAKLAAGAAWRAINESTNEDAAEAELAALLQASTARLLKGI